MTTPPSPLPGWYPNPSGEPGQRYWDGDKWTIVNVPATPPADAPLSPATAPPKPAQAKQSKPQEAPRKVALRQLVYVAAGVVAFVAVMLTVLIANSGGGSDHTKSSTTSSSKPIAAPPQTTTLAPPTSTTTTAPATAYPRNGRCEGNITPKKDGICRVSDGGFFSTGLMAGWIRSAGARAGSSSCMWERLSGPDAGDINMIIEGGGVIDANTGQTEVHIEKTDYAFWSKGCQPWERLTDR